jgi:hypothetical protein
VHFVSINGSLWPPHSVVSSHNSKIDPLKNKIKY